jgi:hypothetical protein
VGCGWVDGSSGCSRQNGAFFLRIYSGRISVLPDYRGASACFISNSPSHGCTIGVPSGKPRAIEILTLLILLFGLYSGFQFAQRLRAEALFFGSIQSRFIGRGISTINRLKPRAMKVLILFDFLFVLRCLQISTWLRAAP